MKPGNPPYLEYVRSTVEQKRKRFESASKDEPRGNPDLEYKSEFVEGWEPSGVPVSTRLFLNDQHNADMNRMLSRLRDALSNVLRLMVRRL